MSKVKQSLYWFSSTYQLADIVRVVPNDWTRFLNKASEFAFTPHIPWLHHILIGQYIPNESDYVIYESIPSHGVAVGRLSWYDGNKYSVLRLNVPISSFVGERVIADVSLFGRANYSYLSVLAVMGGLIKIEYANLLTNHKLKAANAYDMLPYSSDKGLMCIQLVVDAYRKAGVEILPSGCAALPCAFEEALNLGLLIDVTQSFVY